MKQLFLIFYLSFYSLLQAQDYCSPTLWQTNRVIIDGENKEWQQPFKYYNTTASLRFSITNDSTHLYLCFETYEPYNIVKMLRVGWTLQLSCKASKRRVNALIDFIPIMIELSPKYDYTENQNKKAPTFENWLDDYNLKGGKYAIRGFKRLKKGNYSMRDTTALQIALGYTTNKAVYEVAIPFRELFDVNHLDLKEQMKLKVAIRQIDAPSEKGKLSIGSEGFSSINGRRGQTTIVDPEPDQRAREPVDFTKGNPKSRLYHKANFNHNFHLIPSP